MVPNTAMFAIGYYFSVQLLHFDKAGVVELVGWQHCSNMYKPNLCWTCEVCWINKQVNTHRDLYPVSNTLILKF